MGSDNTNSPDEVHLCVLVHGLWGNPVHLDQVHKSLKEYYPDASLEVLQAKSNSGNSTYDGIELGGERVMHEIEKKLAEIEESGRNVTKLSMAGYSLGGIIARYTIGLLYASKFFDKIEPVNFTTFASPHLGVRTPHGTFFNTLMASTISVSGTQLFLVDKFRDTGRPIYSVLADPDSVFMRGLAMFKHRALYANIVNDRAVPFYTGYICSTNPFVDMSTIDVHYVPGYEDVIIDAKRLATHKTKQLTRYEAIVYNAKDIVTKIPFYLLIGLVGIPIGSTFLLVNAGIQSYYSAQRIKLHESGKSGIGIAAYRLPLLVKNAQRSSSRTIENGTAQESEGFLSNSTTNPTKPNEVSDSDVASSQNSSNDGAAVKEKRSSKDTLEKGSSDFPTLKLTEEQFEMIENLDALGFEKYGVHIHKAPHSHAGIIVRSQRAAFSEGKIVLKHWAERFEI